MEELVSQEDDFYPTSEQIYAWWTNVLKSPKHIVAPMVDASELPWRLLSRKYDSHLCFTPMIHSKNFVRDVKYRNENINQCKVPEDRPLIAQFCGNDPEILAQAAEYIKDFCDGVDINLGCPQKIASAGHYGAFLQNEWELITQIVRSINKKVRIPVSCKIRVFDEIEKTVEYARTIEKAGCWMLTVHGRTIVQKGANTGLASWDHIKAVKASVSIPVLANGNIEYLGDVEKCLNYTGVDGVMTAEGNLHNPSIFTGKNIPVWEMGEKYLELVTKYTPPISYVRGHLFKLFQHLLILEENHDLRDMLGQSRDLSTFEHAICQLKSRYLPYFLNQSEFSSPQIPQIENLKYPPWICQPYRRPPIENQNFKLASNADSNLKKGEILKRGREEEGEEGEKIMSKKGKKKMEKRARKNLGAVNREDILKCLNNCCNYAGKKCDRQWCKICCLNFCRSSESDCVGHKYFSKNLKNRLKNDSSTSNVSNNSSKNSNNLNISNNEV